MVHCEILLGENIGEPKREGVMEGKDKAKREGEMGTKHQWLPRWNLHSQPAAFKITTLSKEIALVIKIKLRIIS